MFNAVEAYKEEKERQEYEAKLAENAMFADDESDHGAEVVGGGPPRSIADHNFSDSRQESKGALNAKKPGGEQRRSSMVGSDDHAKEEDQSPLAKKIFQAFAEQTPPDPDAASGLEKTWMALGKRCV